MRDAHTNNAGPKAGRRIHRVGAGGERRQQGAQFDVRARGPRRHGAFIDGQDGWVILWHAERCMKRIKYLPPQYQWSISASCTSASEREGKIFVAVQSLSMGLFWFAIESEAEAEGNFY